MRSLALALLAVGLASGTAEAQWRWTGGWNPGQINIGGHGWHTTISPWTGRWGTSAAGGFAASGGPGGWRVRQFTPYGGYSVGSGTSRTAYGRVHVPGVGTYTAGGNILPPRYYNQPAPPRRVYSAPVPGGGAYDPVYTGAYDDLAGRAAAAQDRARALLDKH